MLAVLDECPVGKEVKILVKAYEVLESGIGDLIGKWWEEVTC